MADWSNDAIRRIRSAVRKVEAMPIKVGGEKTGLLSHAMRHFYVKLSSVTNPGTGEPLYNWTEVKPAEPITAGLEWEAVTNGLTSTSTGKSIRFLNPTHWGSLDADEISALETAFVDQVVIAYQVATKDGKDIEYVINDPPYPTIEGDQSETPRLNNKTPKDQWAMLDKETIPGTWLVHHIGPDVGVDGLAKQTAKVGNDLAATVVDTTHADIDLARASVVVDRRGHIYEINSNADATWDIYEDGVVTGQSAVVDDAATVKLEGDDPWIQFTAIADGLKITHEGPGVTTNYDTTAPVISATPTGITIDLGGQTLPIDELGHVDVEAIAAIPTDTIAINGDTTHIEITPVVGGFQISHIGPTSNSGQTIPDVLGAAINSNVADITLQSSLTDYDALGHITGSQLEATPQTVSIAGDDQWTQVAAGTADIQINHIGPQTYASNRAIVTGVTFSGGNITINFDLLPIDAKGHIDTNATPTASSVSLACVQESVVTNVSLSGTSLIQTKKNVYVLASDTGSDSTIATGTNCP